MKQITHIPELICMDDWHYYSLYIEYLTGEDEDIWYYYERVNFSNYPS